MHYEGDKDVIRYRICFNCIANHCFYNTCIFKVDGDLTYGSKYTEALGETAFPRCGRRLAKR